MSIEVGKNKLHMLHNMVNSTLAGITVHRVQFIHSALIRAFFHELLQAAISLIRAYLYPAVVWFQVVAQAVRNVRLPEAKREAIQSWATAAGTQ